MAAIISNGSTTISPTIRLNAATSYESRNIVHELLGGGVAVTFGEYPLRTGELQLLFTSEASAAAAVAFFKDGYVFELTDPDVSTLNVYFVVTGEFGYELQEDTLNAWLVTIQYQEVIP